MALNHDPGAPLPYNVVVSFDHSFDELEDWCIDNLGPRVRPSGYVWMPPIGSTRFSDNIKWFFKKEEDAVMFDMVWG